MLVRNLRKIKPLLRSLLVSRGPGFEPRRLTTKNILPPTANEQTAGHSDDGPKTTLDNPFRCDPDFCRKRDDEVLRQMWHCKGQTLSGIPANHQSCRATSELSGNRSCGMLWANWTKQTLFCPRKLSRKLVMELARESPSYKSVASPVFCPSYLLKEKAHAQRQLVCSATIGRLISE
jgi:hypothetical protein